MAHNKFIFSILILISLLFSFFYIQMIASASHDNVPDTSYGTCSAPTGSDDYETEPTFSAGEVSVTTYSGYDTRRYDEDGNQTGGSHGYTSDTNKEDCYLSHQSTTGTQSGGTITHCYTSDHSSGGESGQTCLNEYYITSVSVWYDTTITYEVTSSPVTSYPNCDARYPDNTRKPCTASERNTSGIPSEAWSHTGSYDYYTRCYGYTDNERSDYDCTRHYFVKYADVSVTRDFTYEDQAVATVSCDRYYSNGHSINCKDDDEFKYQIVNSLPASSEIFYWWEGGLNSVSRSDNEISSVRYYVTSVEITNNPSDVYTGIEDNNFTCIAYFSGNNFQRNISTTNITPINETRSDVWSTSPYQFLGLVNTSDIADRLTYTDPRGTVHFPHAANNFYSKDSREGSRNYSATCEYYNKNNSNYRTFIFDNTSVEAHSGNVYSDTVTFQHHSPEEIEMRATGEFFIPTSGGHETGFLNNELPDSYHQGFTGRDYALHTWSQYDFVTGHWYDFRAYLQYSDGTGGTGNGTWREITSTSQAPEVYWRAFPWYEEPHENPESYFTNTARWSSCHTGNCAFTGTSGLEHRVPVDGWNVMQVNFFNNNSLENGSIGGAVDPKNRKEAQYWAHQIVNIEITGTNGYESRPTTSVITGQNYNYDAWITWSDDPRYDWGDPNPFNRGIEQENWTNARQIIWMGDDLVTNGTYNFGLSSDENIEYGQYDAYTVSRRVHDDYRTIFVHHGDRDHLRTPGASSNPHFSSRDWDRVYDMLQVYVGDVVGEECMDIKWLRWGCDVEDTVTWQTKINNPEWNFLPNHNPLFFSEYDTTRYFEGDNSVLSEYNVSPGKAAIHSNATFEPYIRQNINDPYRYSFEFPVLGVSSGAGYN